MQQQNANNGQTQDESIEWSDDGLEGLRILARLIGRKALNDGKLAKEPVRGQTEGNSFAGPAVS